ncbi:glycosyltransferase [Pseudomonas sp. FW300-N1A1]|uniref:glycosyltransferase n=1 Tax=Pseudomonas sp. FW300-N1A1 TaxID=2075555 RepID=UPI001304EF8E|nr:glycosyltransferase [Pseudomonas sp. FW300-N1A1]
MLSVSGLCSLPRTPQQPLAPAHEVAIPIDDMPVPGWVRLGPEQDCQAVFLVQEGYWCLTDFTGRLTTPAWRNAQGQWSTGPVAQWRAIKDSLPAPTRFRSVQLPRLPAFPTNLSPIPANIHYLWLGHAVPSTRLIENIAHNCRLSTRYVSTLHVDVQDATVLAQIREQFQRAAPSLVITPLAGTPFFSGFSQSDNYLQYTTVMQGPGRNYSAASDVLRYPLTHHHGGIYMDVDDTFRVDINDIELLAAPNDLLLGPKVSEAMTGFSGYNSSIFASHPNNPLLEEISKEMQVRFAQSDGFFTKARPYVDGQAVLTNPQEAVMDMPAYARELFRLTGPSVLNDVIAVERADYYRLCFNAEPRTNISVTHQLWDQTYVDQQMALIDHYFPFNRKAEVDIGHEHSWFNT